jgi:hypothetical protein
LKIVYPFQSFQLLKYAVSIVGDLLWARGLAALRRKEADRRVLRGDCMPEKLGLSNLYGFDSGRTLLESRKINLFEGD